jgi:hypothetical protein
VGRDHLVAAVSRSIEADHVGGRLASESGVADDVSVPAQQHLAAAPDVAGIGWDDTVTAPVLRRRSSTRVGSTGWHAHLIIRS